MYYPTLFEQHQSSTATSNHHLYHHHYHHYNHHPHHHQLPYLSLLSSSSSTSSTSLSSSSLSTTTAIVNDCGDKSLNQPDRPLINGHNDDKTVAPPETPNVTTTVQRSLALPHFYGLHQQPQPPRPPPENGLNAPMANYGHPYRMMTTASSPPHPYLHPSSSSTHPPSSYLTHHPYDSSYRIGPTAFYRNGYGHELRPSPEITHPKSLPQVPTSFSDHLKRLQESFESNNHSLAGDLCEKIVQNERLKPADKPLNGVWNPIIDDQAGKRKALTAELSLNGHLNGVNGDGHNGDGHNDDGHNKQQPNGQKDAPNVIDSIKKEELEDHQTSIKKPRTMNVETNNDHDHNEKSSSAITTVTSKITAAAMATITSPTLSQSVKSTAEDNGQMAKSHEVKKLKHKSKKSADINNGGKLLKIKDKHSISKCSNKFVKKKNQNSAIRRRRFRSGLDMIRKNQRKKSKSTKLSKKLSSAKNDQLSSLKSNKAQDSNNDNNNSGSNRNSFDKTANGRRRFLVNKSLGETLLHRSARNNRLDVVKLCLESDACDVNAKDNAGYTPLHECSSRGNLEVARLLLQNFADVNASATGGIRPLHDAIENDHIEVVRLLLSYGADPYISTYSGQTPLQLCRSKLMKKFLEGYYHDIRIDQPTNTGHNDSILPWKFDFSNHQSKADVGFDIFANVPSSDDDDNDCDNTNDDLNDIQHICERFRIESSLRPSINLYSIIAHDETNFRSKFYLLKDVIQTLNNISIDTFRRMHPSIRISTINRSDFESKAFIVQLNQRSFNNGQQQQPKKSPKSFDQSNNNDSIEIIYECDELNQLLGNKTTVI